MRIVMASSDVFDVFAADSGLGTFPFVIERVVYNGQDITEFLAWRAATFNPDGLALAYQLELEVRTGLAPEGVSLARALRRITSETPSIIVVKPEGHGPGEQWVLKLAE